MRPVNTRRVSLHSILHRTQKRKLKFDFVITRGRTQIAAGSRTVLGIGPGESCVVLLRHGTHPQSVSMCRSSGTGEQGDRQAAAVVAQTGREIGDGGIWTVVLCCDCEGFVGLDWTVCVVMFPLLMSTQ